ncbi:MAG TPA: hypothetical protein VN616_08750 [Puia sp.]|nr:hypothetical protein [Puia sp.]
MKRILFVGGGKEFPNGAFRFLQSLDDDRYLTIAGLFFDTIDVDAMATVGFIPAVGPYDRLHDRELQSLQANKAIFARKCSDAHLKYQVHPNEDAWDIRLFARESRFADLAILSGEQFYGEVDPSQPNLFLREALHAAECPVMILPERYTRPEHLIIGYDGSRDSLHAIKQFVYLFPEYTDLPTEFVYVKEDDKTEIPDLDLLKEFTRLHFNSMNFSRLQFKAAHFFANWIGDKKNVMLIAGSFGRSPFSFIGRESFSKQVVHEHKMPVFIAHT